MIRRSAEVFVILDAKGRIWSDYARRCKTDAINACVDTIRRHSPEVTWEKLQSTGMSCVYARIVRDDDS